MSELTPSAEFSRDFAPKSEDYRKIIAAADRRKASAGGKPLALFKDDPRTVQALEAWQQVQDKAWSAERLRAAQLISDLLLRGGSEVIDELRGAVAPESLKDVLIRAGADYSLLLLIGEGREAFDEAVALRRAQMIEAEAWLTIFPEPIRFLADKKWSALKQQDGAFKSFENKTQWSKADVLLFRGARVKFAQALDEFRAMHDHYLAAQKKGV